MSVIRSRKAARNDRKKAGECQGAVAGLKISCIVDKLPATGYNAVNSHFPALLRSSYGAKRSGGQRLLIAIMLVYPADW